LTELPEVLDLTPNGLHQPFLERAVDEDEASPEGMLAAFLTLRVVDQFASGAAPSEATGYQVRATEEYLERLDPDRPETVHLLAIVRAAAAVVAHGDVQPLLAPLVAFAERLIEDLKLAQALDVLNTALRAFERGGQSSHVRLQLFRGRVLRQMGLFAEANEAYSIADHLARLCADDHSSLLARIGQGIVLQRRGNLPGARAMLTQVKEDARRVGDRDAEARATHDLAVNHILQGRFADGAFLAFEAFALYDNVGFRRLALSDLGVALKNLGHYEAARDAFELVVAHAPEFGARVNALLELLHVASLRADRIGFERCRNEVEAMQNTLPPSAYVDFNIKVASGFSSFGHPERAVSYLKTAVEHAERHNLNRHLFEAEALLDAATKELKTATAPVPPQMAPDAVVWDDNIEQVAQVLQELHGEPDLVSTYSIPACPWEHNHHADQ
jgi:tetratricopeptide (TPR) repeat protein